MASTDQRIKWMNAINNATLIIANQKEDSTSPIRDAIEDLANWFYLLEPMNNAIEDKIDACNSKEELASLKEEIAATKDKNVFSRFNQKIIELNYRESKTAK